MAGQTDRATPAPTTSLVVGLGEVGRPLLEVLKPAHRMEGIDLPPRPVPGPIEFLHVCYPAEISDFLGETSRYADRYSPQIIVIHSTVPVGTTRAVQQRVRVPVVHSPVRGKHVRMVEELRHYVKFLGAYQDEAAERVERHFQAAGLRTKRLPSPEATELAKLTETTYFGILIAFAQDVDRMARAAGVAYDDVVSFYDEIGYLPPVRFSPGVIGGHCVMPNIKLLKQTFASRLLDAVEWSNQTRRTEGA